VDSVDARVGTVVTTLQNDTMASQVRQFDFIIGADGSGSRVRQAMENQLPEFTTSYKEIPNYATMLELDRVDDRLDKQYLHILSLNPFCIAGAINGDSSTEDVRWYCVVGTNHKIAFNCVEEARLFYQHKAPMILDFVSNESLEAFSKRDSNHIGRRLTCSQLYGGRAVLLGDAGAPFSPIGQGINAAMESAMVFAMHVQGDHPEQLCLAARRYHESWKAEADAVSWISERFVFNNTLHIMRQLVTAQLGLNVLSNAKKAELSYSEVKRQAEWLWCVWAW
jgi:kynurenine 3-monooxygenase